MRGLTGLEDSGIVAGSRVGDTDQKRNQKKGNVMIDWTKSYWLSASEVATLGLEGQSVAEERAG